MPDILRSIESSKQGCYGQTSENLYGPGDNFDLNTSHVLPALIRKFHEAKAQGAQTVSIWGSGQARREFLFVDDLAHGCIFLMQNYDEEEIINIGVGEDIRIHDLAEMIASTVGYEGGIVHDASKPDGTPRSLSDLGRIYCGGGKIGPFFRFISLNSRLFASLNQKTGLNFPPASLRSPKSDRLLGSSEFMPWDEKIRLHYQKVYA